MPPTGLAPRPRVFGLPGHARMIRGVVFLAVGAIVFVGITFFEQIPVLGWLGGAVSVAAWIALARAYVDAPAWDPRDDGMRVGWSGVVGGFTGFVGALTAWGAQTGNLFGLATPAGDRFGAAFGFVGASFGLLYWPLVGAAVCAIAAFMVAARR